MLISIIGAVAMPRYGSALARYRAEIAAKRIVADLRAAQDQARSISAPVRVAFDTAGEQYKLGPVDSALGEVRIVKLSAAPYEARITSVSFGGAPDVTFDGFGRPSAGGAVLITSGNTVLRVVFNASDDSTTVSRYGTIGVTIVAEPLGVAADSGMTASDKSKMVTIE